MIRNTRGYPGTGFHNQMTRREMVLLLLYLPVHIFLLPNLVGIGLLSAGIDYTVTQLNAIYYAVGTVIVLLLTRHFLRRNFDGLCDHLFTVLVTVMTAYVLQMAFTYALSAVKLWVGLEEVNQNNAAIQNQLGKDYGTMFALTVFLAPLIEETIFRGAIFGPIRMKNRWLAYVISIFLFGLHHVWQFAFTGQGLTYLIHILDYVPASWALCWAYERTDTIWTSIALHMLVNAISLTVLGAAV